MKQVVQSYRTGEISLEDVPVPGCRPGGILVRTVCSLISIGTERSVIELGRRSLFGKAAARPDLVKRALAKGRREGYSKTFQEGLGRLDAPTPLGYSAAGTVLEVGTGVDGLCVGDRVACMGAGFASHAEVLWIPKNLFVRIPEAVTFEEAVFGMLGTIALHGVRLGEVPLGSRVGVIGLGLLGLLTVQLLKASGCTVVAYDLDEGKGALATQLGADLVVVGGPSTIACSVAVKHEQGLDAVIITASARDNSPIELATNLCRFRGKIILVGVAHIEIPRQPFWEKEIDFKVSKAGGPGALDPAYELDGIDYPYGYVRWTERRNLEAFLECIAKRQIDVSSLVTHRFAIDEVLKAYEVVMAPSGGGAIGVVLQYPGTVEVTRRVNRSRATTGPIGDRRVRVGVIGAGLFAKSLLLPSLKKAAGLHLQAVATASGVTANHVQKKYGFDYCATDYRALLDDKNIDAVMILTRHSLHAKMIEEALAAGKHIFVEKPLCVSESELAHLVEAYARTNQRFVLTVGYNRRFAPLALQLKKQMMPRDAPMVMTCRVNPGVLAPQHWVYDPAEGGGRIVGELCHFVDLCLYFTDSMPVSVYASATAGMDNRISFLDDVSVSCKLQDGSIAHIVYTASGDRAYSRERIEMFSGGRVGVLEDFRKLEYIAQGKTLRVHRWNQDLGYDGEIAAFLSAVRTGAGSPLPFEQAVAVSLTTFRILDSLSTGQRVELGTPRDTAGLIREDLKE